MKNHKSKVVLADGVKVVASIPGTPASIIDTYYSPTGLPDSWTTDPTGATHKRTTFATTGKRVILVTTVNGAQFFGDAFDSQADIQPNVTKGPDGQWMDVVPYIQ